MRPAHIHFMISAPGWRTLVTHLFVAGDPYLDRDAVFGVKDSLVVAFVDHPETEVAPGRQLTRPWSSVTYDFTLAPLAPSSKANSPVASSQP